MTASDVFTGDALFFNFAKEGNMTTGDKVTFSKSSGRMRVKYTGKSMDATTVKGGSAKLESNKEYECTEKEYHSGLFVRMHVGGGEKVKVKRSELQKVG